jgi:DNA-binding transcriptional LysR family regulator
MLIVNANHPLASKSNIKLQDLRGESFILFREGFALHDRVRDACISEGFEPDIVYESGQWDFIGEMVASNLGIAFLPETVCNKLDPAKVAVIQEIEPNIHWNLAIIWRKNNYISHAARGWIEFVREFFVDSVR